MITPSCRDASPAIAPYARAGATPPRWSATLVAIAIVSSLTGCGVTIPSDPDGTLAGVVNSRHLRVGASPAGSALAIDDGEVEGPLAGLVEEFADTYDAEVKWTIGGEEMLVGGLEAGDLDLVVGDMTDATPWADRVSVTRGYTRLPGLEGRKTVMLVPLGENGIQAALETFLDKEVGG